MTELTIRRAEVEEILDLRMLVLIKGTTRTSAAFEGDLEAETQHFAGLQSGRVVSCLTFLLRPYEGDPAYQLRGMAVHPDFQGQGMGRQLLAFSENEVSSRNGIQTLWCNARTAAVPFYLKQGWNTVGPEFLIEGVGPHFRMVKSVSSSGPSDSLPRESPS